MSSRPNKADHAELQYQSEHARPGKTPTALPYLAVLVAAAFLLLVMAYFMQRRTAESVEGLNQSVNAIHSFDQLADENQSLRLELEQVRGELADAQDRQLQLEEQLRQVREALAQAQAQEAPETSQEPEASPAP